MTKTNSFLKALDKVDSSIKKMQEQSAATRWYFDAGDMSTAYEKAMRLEEVSEKAVLLTRTLPAYTGRPNAEYEVEELLSKTVPVEIGFTTEGWFSIRIPALLPKKASGSADYIRSFLYPAFREFFYEKTPIRYKDCVIVFRHVYDRTRPERQMRDHDNIEVNMVSDIVAMYVLPDDNPAYCSHYYCSASASDDRTEVYVVPKKDFAQWLSNEKFIPDKGVELYESTDFKV